MESTMTQSPTNDAARHVKKIEKLTLSAAFRKFITFPSPQILAVAVLVAWATRLYVGGWNLWHLGLMGAIVLIWPLQEWLIHVFILHLKPIKLFGREFELHLAKKHRTHHGNPTYLEDIFIPLRSLLVALPLGIVLWLVLMPTLELGLTGLAFYLTLGLTYEWTHYLVHTNYRPKTALYRRLWTNHRLHHFKNENYWYGVSMLSGDRLLGTQPDHGDVETSPTCRTLGREDSLED